MRPTGHGRQSRSPVTLIDALRAAGTTPEWTWVEDGDAWTYRECDDLDATEAALAASRRSSLAEQLRQPLPRSANRQRRPAPDPRSLPLRLQGTSMTTYQLADHPGRRGRHRGHPRGPQGPAPGRRGHRPVRYRDSRLPVVLPVVPRARRDDAARRPRPAPRLRRDLSRRRRLPGRPRPRLAVGPAPADPPGLRPVHQPATGAAPRGHPRPAPGPRPGRRRHPLHPREHRGRVRRPRRPVPPGPSPRRRRSRRRSSRVEASSGSFATRSNGRWSASARWRARPSRTRSTTPRSSGTRWSPRSGATTRTSTVTTYHVDALAARIVTAPDTLDVIVASNLFGDILTDIGGALQGSLGPAGVGQPQPRAPLPEPLRACPRIRPAARRTGRRQPDGDGLGRCDAPRAPRRAGGRPPRHGRAARGRQGRAANQGPRRHRDDPRGRRRHRGTHRHDRVATRRASDTTVAIRIGLGQLQTLSPDDAAFARQLGLTTIQLNTPALPARDGSGTRPISSGSATTSRPKA